MHLVFFFKQKTAYEMRIRDWSSDVCSSDLRAIADHHEQQEGEESTRQQHRAQPEQLEAAFGGVAARDAFLHHRAFPVGGGGVSIDRQSVVWGTSVSVRLDLGGRLILKKKRKTHDI